MFLTFLISNITILNPRHYSSDFYSVFTPNVPILSKTMKLNNPSGLNVTTTKRITQNDRPIRFKCIHSDNVKEILSIARTPIIRPIMFRLHQKVRIILPWLIFLYLYYLDNRSHMMVYNAHRPAMAPANVNTIALNVRTLYLEMLTFFILSCACKYKTS